jgi:hypothetical protein
MPDESSPAENKRSNSEILRSLIQTFSNDAQAVAKKKVGEQGFTTNRGEIPFEETLINLSVNRDVLLKSIDSGALPQLPLKIQKGLIGDAQQVSVQLTKLLNGEDALLPFENAVDDLTAALWSSNLQNMSGEILGLQEKLNQLKILEKALRELNQRAEGFAITEQKANNALSRLDEALISVEGSVSNLAKTTQEANDRLEATKISEQKTIASLTTAQQSEKNSAESAATARASSAEVDALKLRANTAVSELESTRQAYAALTGEITIFKTQTEAALKSAQDALKVSYETLDKRSQAELLKILEELRLGEQSRAQASSAQLTASKSAFETESTKLLAKNKETLDAIEKKAGTVVIENETKTAERFAELLKLEDIIREKIRLATNFQLFHAFSTRQEAIAKGKEFWRSSLFYCVGASFVLSSAFIVYLFCAHPTYNAAFYLKLAISIPIIYAIHFCSTQYSKERQLEEEYAFKGNISVSLEPYRELVEKLIQKDDPAEASKYSDFVISSIEKVFTSPTQQILGEQPKNDKSGDIAETSKGFTKILGSINDLIQSYASEQSHLFRGMRL